MEPVHADNQANNEIINFLMRGGAHGHNSPTNMTDALNIDSLMQALQLQQEPQTMPQSPAPYKHPWRDMSPEMKQVYPPKVI